MEIALTWNLVLLAILSMLFAYNFLLGQNSTIKLSLSIYIAMFTADGVAKIIKDILFENSATLQSLFGAYEMDIFRVMRVGLFLIAIIIFVVKGAFHISLNNQEHWGLRMLVQMLFALLSAMLLLATILIYLSGNSFVEGIIFAREIKIFGDSLIAQILIDYYQVWFTLPAIAFLVTSFLSTSSNKRD